MKEAEQILLIENKKLLETIEQLKAENEILDRKRLENKGIWYEEMRKNKLLQEENAQLKARLQNSQNQLGKQIDNLASCVDGFGDKLVCASEKIKSLKKENEQLKAQLQVTEYYKNTYKTYRNMLDCLRNQHVELLRSYSDTVKECVVLQDENKKLKTQLQNSDKCEKCGADIFCHDCTEDIINEAAKRFGWGKN
jgi:regulator of replication initiation timing